MAVETEKDLFTFTWSIHNFSHHCALEPGYKLDSSKFEVGFLNDELWLELYPLGEKFCHSYVSCNLYKKKRNSEFFFRLSILKSNGLFEEKNILHFINFPLMRGFEDTINPQELIKPDSSYIDNDTLTIRCQLWKKNTHFNPVSVMCYAHTRIKVSKLLYTWTSNDLYLEDQNKMYLGTKIPSFFSNIPSLEIMLLNKEASYFDDDTIYLVIDTSSVNVNFLLVYGIHLLDAGGSVTHYITGKHLFKKSTTKQAIDLPFLSKRELLSNKSQYLPNNKLTFQCEFYISFDNPENVVETVEYRNNNALKMKAIPSMNRIAEEKDIWKRNMHKLLKDGEFSDFVISTQSQQFPVHRAILCTQSEVFTAMLKNNMKEKNSNIVEIKDLEDDIISKMLMYLYTNTLDDIDVPTAQELYYAADKYRITTLQKSCSNYLMKNLDVSNVTEILVLADTHPDQDLKSYASAFILEHVFEVINSEKWKNIMATHGHLTSEIMQEIICKKLFDTKLAL